MRYRNNFSYAKACDRRALTLVAFASLERALRVLHSVNSGKNEKNETGVT